MVLVAHPDGGSFCIDSREVTNDQYAAYLSEPAKAALHPECDAGLDPTPKEGWPPAADAGAYPVRALSWCDAYQFCETRGKRLCGDASGMIMTFTEPGTTEELRTRRTEMWAACTQGGAKKYAYGDVWEEGRCPNEGPLAPMEPADAITECEGGHPGIYFLQGNVGEWEGGCKWQPSHEGLSPAFCLNRGPAGCDPDVGAFNAELPEDWSPEVGIRCCADAILIQ